MDQKQTSSRAAWRPRRAPLLIMLAAVVVGTPSGAAEDLKLPALPVIQPPGDGYVRIGSIKPRHARQIDASSWSVGAETMDRDYTVYAYWKSYLGPLGVKKARLQSGWAKTEKQRGQYDWRWLDEIVLDMVDQGVEPWICLCYGNPIYADGGGTGLGGGLPTGDEALRAWERYVGQAVARYGEHVDEWEIWNEPGLRGANAAEQYSDFLVRTAEAVRAQLPQARILVLAMAGIKLDWCKDVLTRVDESGKLNLIDQVTYHPYSYNPDDRYGDVAKLRELIAGFSERIMIRQGENGAPSQRGSFGALSNYDWTEQRQATWALRRLLGDLGRDIPSSYFAICDMQYPSRRNYKGLLAIHDDQTVSRAKISYRAVQHLTAIFDDRFQRVTDCDATFGGSDARHALFVYRSDASAPLVTVWRSADVPGENTEFEELELRVPGLQFDEPVWVDLLSGAVFALTPEQWTSEGKSTTFGGLAVYDSPIVIAERAAVAHALRLDEED